jgi:predicted MFS family arabinose efflux permease
MGLLTFLSAYLKLMGFGDLEIGLFLSVQAIGSLGIRVVAGRMADRYPDIMAFSGLSVISLALFLVYLNPTPPWIYAAAAVFGPGVGLFVPGSQTLALRRSSPSSRGFLSSIYTMGMDIGNLAGPLVFGLIVQSSGYIASFAVAPALMLAAALAVAIPSRIMKPRPKAGS